MRIVHRAFLVLGAALLAWLMWRIGPGELWREFRMLGWGLVPLLLGEGVAEMIHALGWRHCLSGPLRSLSWFALFRIRMAGYAINYLTPTAALGGEVTKAGLLSAYASATEAAGGVLIGKVCFSLAHLVFVIIGALLVFPRHTLSGPLLRSMCICGAIIGAGMIAFLVLQQQGKLGALVRRLAARKPPGHRWHRIAAEVTSVDEALKRFYKEQPLDMVMAMGWHLAGYSIGIAQTWLFFHLLHQDANWSLAAIAWFLGMWFDLFTFAIPLNLGTLEGTRILLLQALGYTPLMGLTYGFAVRLSQLFWSCFGLAGYRLQTAAAAAAKRAARRKSGLPDSCSHPPIHTLDQLPAAHRSGTGAKPGAPVREC